MLFGGDDPENDGLRTGMVLSVVLHVAVVVVGVVGLPFLKRDLPEVEEFVMVVNPQIADITAAPPPAPKKADVPTPPPAKVDSPIPKPEPTPEPPKPEPTPKPPEPKKPEPPKPQPEPPPKPPEPKKEEPKPKPPEPPKKEEPKPEPKPEAKPEPKPEPKKEEPKPEPKKEEPKPEPKKEEPKKPEPKKEEPKKPEPAKKEEPKKDDFDSLMNSALKDIAPPKTQQSAPPKTDPGPARGSTTSTEHASNQVQNAPRISDIATASEREAIRAHVQPHWFLDPGMKGIAQLFVEVRVKLGPDGTVQSAQVISSAPPGTERQFQAFAESARRAVLKSSPIPIPGGKYDTFKDMVLVFRPEDAL